MSVAEGFLVRARSCEEKGLEVKFDLMIVLGQAAWATTFDGAFLLKCLTDLFYPVSQGVGSLTWHFLASQSGTFLSHDHAKSSAFCDEDSVQVKVDQPRSKRDFVSSTSRIASTITSQCTDYDEIEQSIERAS